VEVQKEGSKDKWYVRAYTDMLAAGREELRKAIAEIVKRAVENGWVDAGMAEGWLEKLERGRALMEGWPKYSVGLAKGALAVIYRSTNPDNIEQAVQRLKDMGLVKGVHFSVKMPEGNRVGYVAILKEGLAYAAWLSVHGSGRRRELAAEFVEYILQRAKEGGEEVYENAKEIIEEGRTRGFLTLKGLEKKVEVDGKTHVVKVIGGDAEFKRGRGGGKLLKIKITAEVDGVRSKYAITFGRYARNKAEGRAYANTRATEGREADAERFAAVIKALAGVKPKMRRRSNGKIEIVCGREHLDGFARFAEPADAIARRLEETDK